MKISNFFSRFKKKDINTNTNNVNTSNENYYLMNTEIGKQAKEKKNVDLIELFEDWDSVGSIPYDLGVWLESLIDDQNYIVGIHRTMIDNKDNPLESNIVHSICEKGLYNQGHLLSNGAYDAMPDPSLTISPLNTMLNAVIMMKSTYKNSNGGFIVCLPSNLVDKEGHLINEESSEIYYNNNGITTFKPEYILGFVSNSNGICQFYPKEQILNHDIGRAR